MKINNKISISQKTKLNLTPCLKQSLDILKFSDEELFDYVNKELLENPILTFKSNYDKNYHKKNNFLLAGVYDIYENVSYSNDCLQDYLQEQLNYLNIDKFYKQIAEYIIGNINENGYLEITPRDLIKKFEVSEKTAKKLINLIQTFEPAGIGASNLRESLLIQLKIKNLDKSLAYKIIENHLEDLAQNKVLNISKNLNCLLSDIDRAKKIILSLNPNPASNFIENKKTRYITPDILLKKINNEYRIFLNSDWFYKSLDIDSYYLNIDKKNCTPQEIQYIDEKIQSAKNILNNIEKRNSTILKITSLVVDIQKNYFDKNSPLKALTQKTIANKLGIHESTVSRAIAGKFLETPKGLIKLKHFFQTGLRTSQDEIISSDSLKLKISEIISLENKKRPLSDNLIMEKLNKNGAKISRRCVTKYRLLMNIPSSSERKIY